MSAGHVVLVGAGHANLLVVRDARRLVRAGLDVTLVDPDAFWYSGMAAAVAGGVVHPGRDRVDPAPLAASRGVRLLRGRATGFDPATTTVTVTTPDGDQERLGATAVVLNVGSEVDPRGLPADLPGVVTAKPTTGLLALRDRLLAGPRGARVVVVGGGATAVELAANLTAGAVGRRVAPAVTLVAPGPPVPVVSDRIRARMLAPLRARGVALEVGTRVVGLRPGDAARVAVDLDDGRTLPAEHVLLATGLRAHRAVEDLGLGDAEGMPTTTLLQHPDHPRVLGAGDAIRFAGDGLPRLGVFAVRQAPVLVDNLLALHAGTPLRAYEPQGTFVAALDLGGGDALLMRGDRWIAGRGALAAKRVLDEWFLRRHRVPLGSSGRSWGGGRAAPPGAPEA